MSALIKPLGMLKSYIGGQAEISVEAGRTVRETVAALGMPPEIVALVLVNNAQQLFTPCRSIEETVARLRSERPGATIAVLPDGPQTVPYIGV